LLAADFSSIEARVLAWLAGEGTVLDVFKTHGKIYEHTAGEIFGVPYAAIVEGDIRRQVGKVAELALGYQGGVGALQVMCADYDVKLAPVFDSLWARASGERRDRALRRWQSDGEPEEARTGVCKKEWLASELIKLAWRDSHPMTTRFWKNVEKAAIDAVKFPGEVYYPGSGPSKIAFKCSGSFLLCCLPSKRLLIYPYPEVAITVTKWGEEREALKYKAQDSQKNMWARRTGYGGLLVENITQAVARDVLVDAMLRVKRAKYDIVLHVHDEIVIEAPEGKECLKTFEGLVAANPSWAEGLPIDVKGYRAKRYRK
jgi:DNA polymerase